MRLPAITEGIRQALNRNSSRVSAAPEVEHLQIDSAQHPRERRRGSDRRHKRVHVHPDRRLFMRRVSDKQLAQEPGNDGGQKSGRGKHIDMNA